MGYGVVFRDELSRSARRGGPFVARVLVGAAMGGMLVLWLWGRPGPAEHWDHPALKAGEAAVGVASMALMVILVLMPATVASGIAGSDRAGRLKPMLATPIRSSAIVLGMLGARAVGLATLAVIALPGLAVVAACGGIVPAVIGPTLALLAATAVFVGGTASLASVTIERPRRAIMAAYVAVVGWITMPIWMGSAARLIAGGGGWQTTIDNAARSCNPVVSVYFLAWYGLGTLEGDVGQAGFFRAWAVQGSWGTAGFGLICGMLAMVAAVLLLRPLRLGRWSRVRASRPPSADRTPIGIDPMWWKECRARDRRWRPSRSTAATVAFCLAVGVPLAGEAAGAFEESRMQAMIPLHRTRFNESIREYGLGLAAVAILSAATAGAVSVSGERSRGTWHALETSTLTGRAIARAKVAGAARASVPAISPMALLWIAGIVTGAVHLGGVAVAASVVVAAVWSAAALGVTASMLIYDTNRSLNATLGALLALNAAPVLFVPLGLVGEVAGTWPTFAYVFAPWYLVSVAPVSPSELDWLMRGEVWWGNSTLLRFLGGRGAISIGLAWIALAAVVVHSAVAVGLTRAAAMVFEGRRGAHRPWRARPEASMAGRNGPGLVKRPDGPA